MNPFEAARQAIDRGDIDKLKELLRERSSLATERGEHNHTLSLYAINWPGNKPRAAESMKVLLDAGADPNVRTQGDKGETALHWVASLDHDADCVSVLVNAGADVNARGGVARGGTPLMNAVHFGKEQAIEELLKAGAWKDSFVLAAGVGDLESMKSYLSPDGLLVEGAADAYPGQDGAACEAMPFFNEALGAALFCRQFHCAEWLLQQGATADEVHGEADSTTFHQVARRGSLEAAQFLIAKGANPNVPARVRPARPFEYAAAHAKVDIMSYLIGVTDNVTPEQAAYCGRLDIVMKASEADPKELLSQLEATKTVLGREMPDDWLRARQAVARYLRQKIDGK